MSNAELILAARAERWNPYIGKLCMDLADALEAAGAERAEVVAMAKRDALHGFAADLMTYCLDHSTPERILTQVVGLAKRNGDMAAR